MDFTGGRGADIVFECVGIPGLIAQAVDQVRNKGTILLLGLCTRPDTFNSFAMLSKEVRLVTSAFFTRREYEAALDALDAGAAEPRMLITDTVELDAVPFGIGVQWHPEQNAADRRLFAGLIDAARMHRSRRSTA